MIATLLLDPTDGGLEPSRNTYHGNTLLLVEPNKEVHDNVCKYQLGGKQIKKHTEKKVLSTPIS